MQQKCSRTQPRVARTHGSGGREQCPGSRPPAKADRGMLQPGACCHGKLSKAHVGTPGLGVRRDLLCHMLQPPPAGDAALQAQIHRGVSPELCVGAGGAQASPWGQLWARPGSRTNGWTGNFCQF